MREDRCFIRSQELIRAWMIEPQELKKHLNNYDMARGIVNLRAVPSRLNMSRIPSHSNNLHCTTY